MPNSDKAELFANLTVESAAEAMPKRVVAGRESVPNPFFTAVYDSYAEAIDPNVGPEKAVRQILVPVDAKGMTFEDTKRKDPKTKQEISTGRWQQHDNVKTALYLLRQAAIKQDIGLQIVVDYKTAEDGSHIFDVKKNTVRVRFLGKKKKQSKGRKGQSAA